MRYFRNPARALVAGALAAGLTLAMGSAAYAEDDHDDPKAQTRQFQVKHTDDGETQYCTRLPPVTGSRLDREICKTAEDWERAGVHIAVK